MPLSATPNIDDKSVRSPALHFKSVIPKQSVSAAFGSPVGGAANARGERGAAELEPLKTGRIDLPPLQKYYYGSYVKDGKVEVSKKPEAVTHSIFTIIKHKPVIYNELAIVFAIIVLAFGKAFMLKADFGVTAVQAVPVILSMKFTALSLGVWNLIVQGLYLLIAVLLAHKFNLKYVVAVIIAVAYVFCLDFAVNVVDKIQITAETERMWAFGIGYFLSAVAMTFFFHSHVPLMPFETLEKEIADKRHISVLWVKILLDLLFFVIASGMSYLFFGEIAVQAIGVGTVIIVATMGLSIWFITFVLRIFFDFRFIFIKTETMTV
ncbi:MAG: DUF6198 family protein [Clostridiales bacterium]|jgi:uncharacterized membrane protein YczE|nr:DUF6198 family protein [Clostridiales bacterium]